jgi:hydrogenase/urease accessory protein HupE
MLVLLLTAVLASHQVGLSQGTWIQEGVVVDGELVFKADEAPDLAQRALQGIVVTADGGLCEGMLVGKDLVEDKDVPSEQKDGLAIRLRFTCSHPGRVTVDMAGLLAHLDAGHRHLGRAVSSLGEQDVLVSRDRTDFSFGVEASPAAYVWIGVEHILLGFDHLVFLFALILVGGRWRSLLAVVTAFTVSHSVTLAVSVLGLWRPPGDVIEPLIALSIAWVGVENFVVKDADRRWRITAPFGLIHGFGFAGALAEVGIPAGREPLVLFLFNVGVELGQVAVLVVTLPLLQLARRRGLLDVTITRVVSAGVVVLALYWFVERVFRS